MLDHHPNEPFFGFNYNFKRDTLYPYLEGLLIFLLTGFVLAFVPGNLDPLWSIPFFILAVLCIGIIWWHYRHSDLLKLKERRKQRKEKLIES